MAYNLKTPKEKKEKEDIFTVPKGLDEEKSEDLFSMKSTEQENIDEINADLYAEQSPIKIKDKSTLFIEANGKTHEVSKNDVVEYHEKYRLDGMDGNDIHGFRSLGSIKGDYQAIDVIYKDANRIFNQIDSSSGGYKTIPSDDDE